MKPDLLLVDGSSFLFRAYHALPQLTSQQGEPTGAVYGFLQMLGSLFRQTPTAVYRAVVMDSPERNFRYHLYPAYKQHRVRMPEALSTQIPFLYEILRALGIPLIVLPGVEADDVLGTLAVRASQAGLNTLIATGDKDLAQLVTDNIYLCNTMSSEWLDPAGVEKKFGVRPGQIIDYLMLVGDSSDNLPGVSGVGAKTAVQWLQQYGSLADILAHQEHLKGRGVTALRQVQPEFLNLMRDLVTIRTDVCPFDLTELQLKPMHSAQIQTWFTRLDLRKTPGEMGLVSEQVAVELQHWTFPQTLETIQSPEQWNHWVQHLKQADYWSFDTETTSLDPHGAELVGISFALPDRAAYLPLRHQTGIQLSWAQVYPDLKALFSQKHTLKIAHNLKFDWNILRTCQLVVQEPYTDTMLESYALSNTMVRYDLNSVVKRYGHGAQTMSYSELVGPQQNFAQVELTQAAAYAIEDVQLTLKLHQQLEPLLAQEPNQHLLAELDLKLISVLADMEYRGIHLDAAVLQQQGQELAVRLEQLRAQVFAMAGEVFNIDSPKQLQTILFDKLGLIPTRKTKTGQYSTDENTLQELAMLHDLPHKLLEYRSLAKLKSTYIDKLPGQINPQTHRLHTSYHLTGTLTGRLSSSDPNLQNIPVKTPEGRNIRKAFVAAPDHQLLSVDYSQIELRIMAHYSQDQRLLEAFAQGRDIHQQTASDIFSVPLESVTSEQRRQAKAINFGLMYGMSAFGLAKALRIPRHLASEFIERYFEQYPGVQSYMTRIQQGAQSTGYVETLFGRRLWIPDIQSRDARSQNSAQRLAINAPMQGSAADIIKQAMWKVHTWLTDEKIPAYLLMQVHDELVLEVHNDVLPVVIEGVSQRMVQAAQLSVPLLVNVGVGKNWGDLEKF